MGKDYCSVLGYGFYLSTRDDNFWEELDNLLENINKEFNTKIDHSEDAYYHGEIFIHVPAFENRNNFRSSFGNDLDISFSISKNDLEALQKVASKFGVDQDEICWRSFNFCR